MPARIPNDRNIKRTAARKPPVVEDVIIGMPDSEKYAPKAWGKKAEQFEDLTVPSGQVCQVRRPGVEGLLKAGVLNEMDSLTSIVNDTVRRNQGRPPTAVSADLLDMDNVEKILEVVDKVTCYVVIQPAVMPVPEDGAERDDEFVYIDQVDLEDKMFILNFAVGGTRDLERFRQEVGESLRGLAPVPDVAD